MPASFIFPSEVFQYFSGKFSLGFLLKVIRPLAIFLMAVGMVIVSNPIFSNFLNVEEIPNLKTPYYLAILENLPDDKFSYVYSNLPSFLSEDIIPLSGPASFQFLKRHDDILKLKLILPNQAKKIFSMRLLFPFSVSLTLPHITGIPQLLDFSFGESEIQSSQTVFGELVVHQTQPLKKSFNFNEFLDNYFRFSILQTNLSNFLKGFDSLPFRSTFLEKSRSGQLLDDSIETEVEIIIRVRGMLVEHSLTYWQHFKRSWTYIFYWCVLFYFLWNYFVSIGFEYRIFSAERRILISPSVHKKK